MLAFRKDGKMDVVIDTDAFNEIDDQFSIAYALANPDRLNVVSICAAPFLNDRAESPKEGMEKSAREIEKLLHLAGREDLLPRVMRGSERYLPDENTPVESAAARDIASRAASHTPEEPLYVVALGAITNVASAILMDPAAAKNMVLVWLGGHAIDWPNTREFNMMQDIAAARVVFSSEAMLVQLPCFGVVSEFRASKADLEAWLVGKNPMADYLARNAIDTAESYAHGTAWSRVIWDVTATAWLLSDGGRFMNDRVIPAPIPEYDDRYAFDGTRRPIRYVYSIERDALMTDLFVKLLDFYGREI